MCPWTTHGPVSVVPGAGPGGDVLVAAGSREFVAAAAVGFGVRDAAALALAVSGLVIIGPMELFFPFEAAARFGPHVWLLLLALYAMGVVLVLLLLRPRLVIYNISVDTLRPILAELVDRLDAMRGGRAIAWYCRGWACNCMSTTSPPCGARR